MDTGTKLEEADYFLKALVKTKETPKHFEFNLSAFLSAWKSVLDVMLYDLAEYYSIGLTRDDKVTEYEFGIIAKSQNRVQALRFLEWWRKKVGVLSQNPFWNMRHIFLHRGYPRMTARIYIPASISSSAVAFTVPLKVSPKFTREFVIPDLINGCKEAYELMNSIVSEAEKEFNIGF